MGATFADWLKRIFLCWLTLFMTACSHSSNYAPVADLEQVTASPDSVKKITINQPAADKSQTASLMNQPKLLAPSAQWVWPAKGKIISAFGGSHKGVNIGGKERDPIFAAADGKVVYAGNGLRGYGNLLIIKHNSHYLSAYAHNRLLNVKVGDRIVSGQKIAEMGHTGTNKVMLHFEVRKDGKPINPLLIRGIMN